MFLKLFLGFSEVKISLKTDVSVLLVLFRFLKNYHYGGSFFCRFSTSKNWSKRRFNF